MSRKETHQRSKAQFAHDVKCNAGQNGRKRKGGQCGGTNGIDIVFTNDSYDLRGEDIKEWLFVRSESQGIVRDWLQN